ncbi:MAG: DUF6144 family protein [Candidatus Cloacimonetes bacterium]|nr:DUF6144 family protein [Candidatus Cloacimonadota bacterium]MCF7813131.1 DUF6144 family protein [Candidatus Cloacimonadota bacterium]MCF7867579.1 DUF6144 family protein [Candidatus Cloacimonadota bacterium]MCF7883146.1 DUF6144 family protein [Candidatus Cloacimonadota bacterium]
MKQFEKQWLQKLQNALQKIGREDLFDGLISGKEDETMISWSKKMMEKLSEELTQKQIEEVMCGCACLRPKTDLKELRKEYCRTKDIKTIHQKMQGIFEVYIKKYKQLSDQQIDMINELGMGMVGKLEDNIVTVSKIPKEFHKYFACDDEKMKKYYYCHCPRIREVLLSEEEPVDTNYCYCGAGFYKDIWEFILQKPVKVKLIESIMQGDDVCKIKIEL